MSGTSSISATAGVVNARPVNSERLLRQGIPLVGVTLSAVGLGAAVSQVAVVPLWEVLTVALAVLVCVMACRMSFVHPLVLFPLVYLTYFGLGSLDWVESWYRTPVVTNEALRLPVLGLVAYMCGVIAVRRPRLRSIKPTLYSLRQAHDQFRWAGTCLATIGVIGAAGAILRHGLLLSNPGARAGGLGYIGTLTYALIPAAVLLAIAASTARRRAGVLTTFALLLMVSAGYRVAVVLTIVTYLAFMALEGRLHRRNVALGLVVLVAFAALIANYRREALGGTDPYGSAIRPTHWLADVPVLTPLYYAIPYEGASVLTRLTALVPARHQFMEGQLQLAPYATMLPGKQLDARAHVTQLIYDTSRVQTTLTPTILGAPYFDFGLTGVVIEMVLLGALLAYLYRRQQQRASALAALAYAYCLALSVAGIHTGLLDAQFELVIPLVTALALWGGGRSRARRAVRHPEVSVADSPR
jgi:uncharacterized membrane protein